VKTLEWELDQMPNEKWGVAKVKGIEPEQFFIFLINTEGSKGPLMRASEFLSEEELRSDMKSNGAALKRR
jgi:hypothetical protein